MTRIAAVGEMDEPVTWTQPRCAAATEDKLCSALEEIPLTHLAALSRTEMERYLRREPSYDCYAFELFRRAICERDPRAWEAIYAQYHHLLRSWVHGYPVWDFGFGSAEECICDALARFWRCVPPERFANFPSTAALLRYLKVCVHSVLIDEVRRRTRESVEKRTRGDGSPPDPFSLDTLATPDTDAERIALGRVTGEELWAIVAAEARNESEQIVARLCFVQGMKPQDVRDRHPERFASVKQVYDTKRNLLDRLRRNPTIQQFLG